VRTVTLIATALLAGCAGRSGAVVGYTYECRPGADGRKILARVHALDAGGDTVLVSIADGPNPPRAPRIAFAAFDRKTFARSCPNRSTKAVLRPDFRFKDTYAQWKADLPLGKAGVYDKPVAQVVAAFRTLPVPPFVGEPGEPPAVGLLGPGPNAVHHLTEPQP
jgi:hypothetical protein